MLLVCKGTVTSQIALQVVQALEMHEVEEQWDVIGPQVGSCNITEQAFKVRQPQRAARSKQPNTPSDGSKHNGFQTTNHAELIPKHVRCNIIHD